MSFEPLIRSLYTEKGELTAPAVVDAARPKDAPLHPYFEWDDSTAAELHRQEQARSMIRRVRFVVDPGAIDQGVVLREFRSVVDASGVTPRRVYRHVADMTPAEEEEVRTRMELEIASLVRRYRDQSGFWEALSAAREQAA